VNVLLDDDVASEHLVHIERAETRLARVGVECSVPGAAGEIDGLDESDTADIAAVSALRRFLENGLRASLEIDEEADLAVRLFGGRFDRVAAWDVHRDRLREVNMLAGIDGRGGMLGMIVGRRLDDDGVDLRSGELGVSPRAVIGAGGVDLEFGARGVEFRLDDVGERDDARAGELLE
jgi:hypothetical protein